MSERGHIHAGDFDRCYQWHGKPSRQHDCSTHPPCEGCVVGLWCDEHDGANPGAGRAVQDDGLPTLVRELADALEGLTPFVRVGDGPLGYDPAAIAMRRAFDALGEAKPLRAAPPLHDPQEPERG